MSQLKFFIPVFLFIFFIFSTLITKAEEMKVTLSGVVKDSETGEELIGAAIYIEDLKSGAITNLYGYYSITLSPGVYTLKYSYLGYVSVIKQIDLKQSVKLDIELKPDNKELEIVEVTGEKLNKNVTDVEMGTAKLQMKTIQLIPALMGEVDVIKSIQLLPGVASSGEGSIGFYVRGGAVDQNLILLDDATVYNAAHLGGLFSVFNQDAVKDVKLYKGGIPAEYGGRLASLLDVRMKEGNSKKLAISGGIGLISSRLTIESPIIKDRSSFLLSGRRTYVDLFFPLSKQEAVKQSTAYFYDFNAKVNYRINDNNRLFLSGYFGRDIMAFGKDFQIQYGNQTTTLRYNHLFSEKLFSNITAVHSNFYYALGAPTGPSAFIWESYIIDNNFKNDYTWYINTSNTVKWGYSFIHHKFDPGKIKSLSSESFITDMTMPVSYALEHGVFISHEMELGEIISLDYGIRFSLFQNFGPGTFYTYKPGLNGAYSVIDTLVYKKNDFFNTYYGWEPRLGIRVKTSENGSVKASFHQTYQYVHLATNTMSPTPFDIWFPSSVNIKPQKADQVALGYFHNIRNDAFAISVETYYKRMYNSIDFKDHAMLLANPYLEGEIRTGSAESYGIENQIKKQSGKLQGWISYTWSRVFYTIPEINNGNPYPAAHDKPHNISVVLSYNLLKNLNISANWVYSTGSPRTMPTGRFEYQGMIAPVYSDRNSVRLPDYHRADISITYDFKKYKRNGALRKVNHSMNISVFNAYNRHNANSIQFKQDSDNPTITYAEKMYLFKIFPSVTYNFNF